MEDKHHVYRPYKCDNIDTLTTLHFISINGYSTLLKSTCSWQIDGCLPSSTKTKYFMHDAYSAQEKVQSKIQKQKLYRNEGGL